MLPVAARLSSAQRPHRIVSAAPNLRNDEAPGLARPSRFCQESRAPPLPIAERRAKWAKYVNADFSLDSAPPGRRIRRKRRFQHKRSSFGSAGLYQPPPLRGHSVFDDKKVLLIDPHQLARDARARVLCSHGIDVVARRLARIWRRGRASGKDRDGTGRQNIRRIMKYAFRSRGASPMSRLVAVASRVWYLTKSVCPHPPKTTSELSSEKGEPPGISDGRPVAS